MPELPEVETIRQDLRRKILGHTIKSIIINTDKVAGGKSARQKLVAFLPGKNFDEVERIGKLIMIKISNASEYLLVHLKMTGQMIYTWHNQVIAGGHSFATMNTKLPDKHTLVTITFDNGGQLFFNDMRRFGYFKLVSGEAKAKIVESYGIEPLTPNFTLETFAKLFKKRKTVLKALLLNQALISGIGNIYADEICHLAKVKPMRRVNTLTQAEIKRLFVATEKVIAKAIAFRGTTFNNYVDSEGNKGNFTRHLKVYERTGERCKTCRQDVVKKVHAAGRGTHFCGTCQK